MQKVRFGLVGFGAWGQHHARAIVECPEAELAAIVTRTPSNQAEARARHPSAEILTDLHDLVARPDIDVVDVVLPTDMHFAAGMAALQAGKHLLMEKPLALAVEHCEQLQASAKAQNRLLAVGHEFRLSSLWGKAKAMIDARTIGEPLYVLIELWRRPYRNGAQGWRYDLSRVGNWILEEPIHFFDLARWYLSGAGEPVSLFARANSRQPNHPELQDNFSAIVNFPNGAYAVISQTLAAFEHHQVVKITGTTGALWASWSGAMDRTFNPTYGLKHFDGKQVSDVPLEKPSGEVFELVEEIGMMARAIRKGGALAATGKDGEWSVRLCLKAQESVERGTVVPL